MTPPCDLRAIERHGTAIAAVLCNDAELCPRCGCSCAASVFLTMLIRYAGSDFTKATAIAGVFGELFLGLAAMPDLATLERNLPTALARVNSHAAAPPARH